VNTYCHVPALRMTTATTRLCAGTATGRRSPFDDASWGRLHSSTLSGPILPTTTGPQLSRAVPQQGRSAPGPSWAISAILTQTVLEPTDGALDPALGPDRSCAPSAAGCRRTCARRTPSRVRPRSWRRPNPISVHGIAPEIWPNQSEHPAEPGFFCDPHSCRTALLARLARV
jgi:hypothetical protein